MRGKAATSIAFVVLATLAARALAQAPAVVVQRGIVYGKGGDVELALDLAGPADEKGPFPALVFVHGGGWRAGDRSMFFPEILRAAERGYVAATVSYRLTSVEDAGKPRYPWPAQIEDVKCAVRWLRANASLWRIDPERIGAMGGSAGGHLVLLLGMADSSAGLEGSGGNAGESSRVQAVVNFFGPTELVRCHETSPGGAPLAEKLLGGTPREVPGSYRDASPVTYASADDPPALTMHGDRDAIVPIEQAKILDERLKAAGVRHDLAVFAGEGHGWQGAELERSVALMYDFFDRHLKGGAGSGK
ncbi:MAG: alpha/beta hydrolase [Planctomycetes bacterium]|nr:alpha/beta hydrolase [Planctomycetota bacterium]